MNKSIIDTNVIKTADLATEEEFSVSVSCIEKCLKRITFVKKHGGLLVDSGWEIISEYKNNFANNPQSIAWQFLKWVLTHQKNRNFVEMCCVEKTGESYNEFPNIEELYDFDPADKKFIALANTYQGSSTIYEATDSEWWGYREAFMKAKIEVDFLCKDYIKKIYEQKYGM